jgi:CubicO group peptidase (beta-lactamase class C family)
VPSEIAALIERQHRHRNAAAQICVIRDDSLVYERCWNCSSDALFLIYSASKPFVALLVHLLAERGKLRLDDRVAAYWPQFAAHGKEAITIRQVLQHRSGLPITGGLLATVFHLPDWKKSVRDAEVAKPRWPPGEVPAYHFVSYGFILGELVERVAGRPLRQMLSSEFLEPLGLNDVHLGLPDKALSRAVPVLAGHPGEWINQLVFNRRRVRQAVIPAASISSNARQLAHFYQMLVRGGELDGVRVLRPETILEARTPSSDGVIDAFIKRPVRWSQGFQLGGPSGDPRDIAAIMGRTSGKQAFGHGGNASCLTWADPTRRLSMAYLSNVQPGIDSGIRHVGEVSDAVLAAFG